MPPPCGQSEAGERSHMEHGMTIADTLDAQFGIRAAESGREGASQKDEPGVTLGMVKMMADAGVRLLHVGVNDFSTVPAVPSSSPFYHGHCNTYVLRDTEASPPAELTLAHCSGYSEAFQVTLHCRHCRYCRYCRYCR